MNMCIVKYKFYMCFMSLQDRPPESDQRSHAPSAKVGFQPN